MSFDTSVITSVSQQMQAGFLLLSWMSTAPAGAWYQVYYQNELVCWTQALRATLIAPSGPIEVRIGSVAGGEQFTDFSSTFTPIPNRASLSWIAGAFQGDGVVGNRVYGAPGPGQAVSYTRPLADITTFEQGDDSEGYGEGQYGSGGYGDAHTLSWISDPLRSGTWQFAIVPYDAAGNEGTPSVVSVAITGRPAPPARNSRGKRLGYAYNTTSHVVTLQWLASPV